MISVIIPTLNRPAALRKVLPSYLSQSHVLEVIIVDDSTSEEHRKDIRELAQSDPRLRVVQDNQRLGLTAAKNRGVRCSKGPFVFFGEDDLILLPDHLEILFAHQKVWDADIIGGRKVWLNRGETVDAALKRTVQKKGKPFDTFLLHFNSDQCAEEDMPAPFLQTSSLIKRSVFQGLEFDECYVGFVKGYCWGEETDFFMSANEKGFRVMFCPHVVSFNSPPFSGGTHRFAAWESELWIWRNHLYLLKKHRNYIKNVLGNRTPIPILWISYLLVRLYGQMRNLLWYLSQGMKRIGSGDTSSSLKT